MDVNLEIRHLKLLVAIAEEESVTAAAKRLFLTQSALSHQLRDAEERMGTALFLRMGKKMVLTTAGEKLVDCAGRVLRELECVETQILELSGQTHGRIRLSTECYTCYHWLPPVLAKFHASFPKVDVTIDMGATADPVAKLLSGALDVAIINCVPDSKNLCVNPLFEDELFVVMSPDHPLTRRDILEAQDLAEETLLIYPPREESTLIEKVMRPAGVEPHRVMEIPLTEAILELAAAGTGIAFLASWALTPHLKAGKIAVRSMGDPGFRRHWYSVTLRQDPMPQFLREFLNLLAVDLPKCMKQLCESVAAV